MNSAMLYLLPLLMQGAMGAYQLNQAGKHKMDRPTYEIPPAALDALNMSQTNASQTENPYASLERQDIQSSMSQGIGAIEKGSRSGSDVLSGINSMVSGTQKAYGDLASKNIDYKQKANQEYVQQLMNMQQQEQNQWQYNQGQKYNEESAARSALLGAGIQNIAGAGINAATGAAGVMQTNKLIDMLKTEKVNATNQGMQDIQANAARMALPQNDAMLPNNRTPITPVNQQMDMSMFLPFMMNDNNQNGGMDISMGGFQKPWLKNGQYWNYNK